MLRSAICALRRSDWGERYKMDLAGGYSFAPADLQQLKLANAAIAFLLVLDRAAFQLATVPLGLHQHGDPEMFLVAMRLVALEIFLNEIVETEGVGGRLRIDCGVHKLS